VDEADLSSSALSISVSNEESEKGSKHQTRGGNVSERSSVKSTKKEKSTLVNVKVKDWVNPETYKKSTSMR